MTSLRFAIIGAGRLGASIALALRAEGASLLGYMAATAAGRARAQAWLGGTASATLDDLASLDPDVYFVTVPDSALDEVSSRLADLLTLKPDRVVIHTSGAASITALASCARVGAITLKFHPLQTFADPLLGSDRFRGAAVAITPDSAQEDSPAVQSGFALARILGMRPFLLADEDRVLYHAAATFACNYFVTLEHIARHLFVKSGLPSDEALSMFLPLVAATLDNIQAKGTVDALTGPLSRGDAKTVRDHLNALSQGTTDLLPLYQRLGAATLDIVRARGDLDDSTVSELAGLLTLSNGNHIHTPNNLPLESTDTV